VASSRRRHVTPHTEPPKGEGTPKRAAHWYHPAIPHQPPPEADDGDPHRGRARERLRRRQEDRHLPQVEWTWGVIALAVVGALAVIALLLLTVTNTPDRAGGVSSTAASGETPTPGGLQAVPVELLPTVEIKTFNGTQRLTILLMGLDKRPGEEGRGFRSDTMMILSLDPTSGRLSMLSIPRDIYVPIPLSGETEMRPINTAYVLGELRRPGYGPGLAAETVEYNFGIKIDYYVVLSFESVIYLVDAIGGIDIDVPTEIDDPEFPDFYTYGYDPLYIPAGRIHMDGVLALKYARTRHQTSDFDRARRQQQVILALRERATKAEVLAALVPRIPEMWGEVSKGILTDLPFDQLLSIGWFVKDIPLTNLHRGAVDGPYIRALMQGGYSILTVNRETISTLMLEVFGENYSQ